MEVFIEAIFFRDEMDRREREKKAWSAIYGKEYQAMDDEAKKMMDKLDLACKLHKQVLGDGKLAGDNSGCTRSWKTSSNCISLLTDDNWVHNSSRCG